MSNQMWEARNTIQLVFNSIVVGCTVHYFYLFFKDPELFHFLNRSDLQPASVLVRALRWPYFIAVLVGAGVCLYKFGLFAFAWMPESWKVLDQLEGQSAAQLFAAIFAFICGVGLSTGMNKLAKQLAQSTKPD